MRLHTLLLAVLSAGILSTQATGKVKRPELVGDTFDERFKQSYLAVSTAEPEVTEIERAILDKLATMIESNQEYAKKFLSDMLGEGNPVSAAFNHSLGNLYYESGDYERAEKEYRVAISKFRNFRRAWNGLGLSLYQMSDYNAAADALGRSVKLGAADSVTYGLLGYCLLQQGHLRSAETAYSLATLNDPTNMDWAEGVAQIYSETGRFHEAQAILDELIDNQPENPDFWLLKANNYLSLDEPLKTARSIEIARRLGTIDKDTYYLLGNIYLDKGLFEAAKEVYVSAVKQEGPVDNLSALQATRYLIVENEVEIAREVFELINEVSENWTERTKSFYFAIQGSFAQTDGFTVAAEDAYMQALEHHPFNGRALLALAELKADENKLEDAYIFYDRALNDEGAKYSALVSKSMLLIRETKYEEAQRTLEAAMAMKSDSQVDQLHAQLTRAIRDQQQRQIQ